MNNMLKNGSIAQAIEFSHTEEYGVIKRDLVRVGVLNLVYLAAIMALYFTDSKSHYLESWFSRLPHF